MPCHLQWLRELRTLSDRRYFEPMTSLHDLTEPWLQTEKGARIGELIEQVSWLGQRLYQDYEPYEYETFSERLVAWISQVDDDRDRQTLFRMLDNLFFVGRREFESLCRAAFHDSIVRWLIEREQLAIDAQDLDSKLSEAVARTWFCAVTDSMRINAFLKVNGLRGQSHRPDWRSLAMFAQPNAVQDFMKERNLERIVLLEDFVGSGSQLEQPVKFAASISTDIHILVMPLICCPKGLEKGIELQAEHQNVTFSTVLNLSQKLLVAAHEQTGEPEEFEAIRNLVDRVKPRFSSANAHQPFGYRATGALVVMYSNCPDNTLPIVHDDRGEWHALFPRIERE